MNKTICSLLISGLLAIGALKAQGPAEKQPLPLFRSQEILNLTLKADFRKVFSVTDDSTYFPAVLALTDNDGQSMTLEIRIRTRGKTRREKEFCSFPPLRLNFPKSKTANTPFEGQNAIKLVTHCDKAGHYERNTVVEYLIYKAFNILTDSSFMVRPAVIDYIYEGKKADTVQRFAFFLEREKHLAERLDGTEIESGKAHPDRLNPYQTCLVDMFQYMIGNTDYSIYEMHNIVLLGDTSGSLPLYPVPYDFDWSGLVSASYAEPHPFIDAESVTERVYRGIRRDPEVVAWSIRVFNSKKMEIFQLFESYERLDQDERKKAIRYLEGFYEIINNERKVRTEFFDNARVVYE